MESIRATDGNDGVFRAYWEFAARIHNDRATDFDMADALTQLGLDAEHCAAVEDDAWDEEIRSRMDVGLSDLGDYLTVERVRLPEMPWAAHAPGSSWSMSSAWKLCSAREQADLELSGPEVGQNPGKVKEEAERHLGEKGSHHHPKEQRAQQRSHRPIVFQCSATPTLRRGRRSRAAIHSAREARASCRPGPGSSMPTCQARVRQVSSSSLPRWRTSSRTWQRYCQPGVPGGRLRACSDLR
jgi:hypothetical protein